MTLGLNDTILVDKDLNRVNSISVDYYIKDTYVTWVGYIYNDTTNNIDDCKISTSSTFGGVFSVSGGGITGYQSVTSNWDTTCSIGPVISGGTKEVIVRTFIADGSSLTGFQAAPLYILK